MVLRTLNQPPNLGRLKPTRGTAAILFYQSRRPRVARHSVTQAIRAVRPEVLLVGPKDAGIKHTISFRLRWDAVTAASRDR